MADGWFYPDDMTTHIERINPGENPAYIPGLDVDRPSMGAVAPSEMREDDDA